MLKEGIFLISLLVLFPVASATLSESMGEIQSYVNDYNSGVINAPQLIVYMEYAVSKMYRDSGNSGSFTESEIENIFEKTDAKPWEGRSTQYEKTFKARDFDVIFTANSYYNYDRDYWESRS